MLFISYLDHKIVGPDYLMALPIDFFITFYCVKPTRFRKLKNNTKNKKLERYRMKKIILSIIALSIAPIMSNEPPGGAPFEKSEKAKPPLPPLPTKKPAQTPPPLPPLPKKIVAPKLSPRKKFQKAVLAIAAAGRFKKLGAGELKKQCAQEFDTAIQDMIEAGYYDAGKIQANSIYSLLSDKEAPGWRERVKQIPHNFAQDCCKTEDCKKAATSILNEEAHLAKRSVELLQLYDDVKIAATKKISEITKEDIDAFQKYQSGSQTYNEIQKHLEGSKKEFRDRYFK